MAQAAKQLKKIKDIEAQALQEQKEKEESNRKRRNRSRDRKKKHHWWCDGRMDQDFWIPWPTSIFLAVLTSSSQNATRRHFSSKLSCPDTLREMQCIESI